MTETRRCVHARGAAGRSSGCLGLRMCLGLLGGSLLHLGVADDLLDDLLVLLPTVGVLPPDWTLVLTINAKMFAGATHRS